MPNCMTTFADVIQKAHRAQVIVVSPNILMLAISTIQTVMKDARMREQADLIRKEVGVLLQRREAAGRAGGQAATPFQPGRSRHQGHHRVSTDKIIEPARADRKGGTGAAGRR